MTYKTGIASEQRQRFVRGLVALADADRLPLSPTRTDCRSSLSTETNQYAGAANTTTTVFAARRQSYVLDQRSFEHIGSRQTLRLLIKRGEKLTIYLPSPRSCGRVHLAKEGRRFFAEVVVQVALSDSHFQADGVQLES